MLHSYIRRSTVRDPPFKIIDEDSDFIPSDLFLDIADNPVKDSVERSRVQEMSTIRDNIASSLVTVDGIEYYKLIFLNYSIFFC